MEGNRPGLIGAYSPGGTEKNHREVTVRVTDPQGPPCYESGSKSFVLAYLAYFERIN